MKRDIQISIEMAARFTGLPLSMLIRDAKDKRLLGLKDIEDLDELEVKQKLQEVMVGN